MWPFKKKSVEKGAQPIKEILPSVAESMQATTRNFHKIINLMNQQTALKQGDLRAAAYLKEHEDDIPYMERFADGSYYFSYGNGRPKAEHYERHGPGTPI